MIPIGDNNTDRTITPFVNYILIAINILVFVFLQGMGGNEAFLLSYSTVPNEILTGRDIVGGGLGPSPEPVYLTLITSMFMHGGIAHLFGNMLFLWIFGDNVEDRVGHIRYIVFYGVTGLLASLAHVFTTVAFAGANEASMLIPSLGASGAISGVLGGYLLMFPTRRVMVIISWFVTAVPAFIAIGLWFVFQLISGLGMLGSGAQAGGVAYAAHIGGFVAGLVLIKIFTIGRPASENQAPRGYYEQR